MSELLRISGLWGGYKEGVDILRGIDMSVAEGEAVGIIGLNGSGKSTLGKAIMNMIPFRKGEILLGGEDITPLPTYELAQRGISIMQQGGQVFRNLSVWENLQMAFGDKMDDGFGALQELIPMLRRPRKELSRTMADRLSGGQRHQLSLAMALATRPRLVILDEPSAGLSPKAVEEMYGILGAVREKMHVTILLIEQNVAKAVGFCDRTLVMVLGQVMESTDVDDYERLLFNK